MKIEQKLFSPRDGWQSRSGSLDGASVALVLAFGGRTQLEDSSCFAALRDQYPQAHIVMGSTSGEIVDTEITEDHIAATAIAFERTRVRCAAVSIEHPSKSRAAGQELARRLAGPELAHVFVLSDGGLVNGTELSQGFNETLPPGVLVTGGLAGDGARFARTVVGLDEPPVSGRIVAIACYGTALKVGFGSSGGWSPFGPERTITRADGNTLFELEGQSALKLYKEYLGDQAAALPGSALRFPLLVTPREGAASLVRTILSIDEASQTMVFAGDVPLGSRVRFMRASYEDLIDGAGRAAESSRLDAEADLAICVSCVGRRIVLGQRTEEETENVRAVLGRRPVLTGFYSYGELAPAGSDEGCQLHNQTMTITTLRES